MALALAIALALALVWPGTLLAKEWPRPAGPVADYAGVIGAPDQERIAALSTELYQKTKVSVVVATVSSLEGRPLEETAVDLYRSWGIGDKATSRGALILVAVGEKRVRIEVGYGFEGTLTDMQSGLIRDQVLIPLLRKSEYGQALYQGVAAIGQLAAAEAGVSLSGAPEVHVKIRGRASGTVGGTISFFTIILIILVIRAVRRGRGGRGGRGGDGDGFWIGLLLGSMMGGGHRHGGGGGGFDSFGGGFGGFGGGMSGGGGASGDFGGGD